MVAPKRRAVSARRRVRTIHRRLERDYGEAVRQRFDPLDELMLTILSQNTSDTNRDRAYSALTDRFEDWEAVRTASRSEIEDAIRPAGLWKQKAGVLQATLDGIHEDRGRLDLDHLADLSDEEVLDYLTGFRGVGLKTAACVLCFSLDRPYMPVDTHVLRITRRLELIPEASSADDAHDRLNREDVVPAELRFSFHIQLIRHGRAICRAGRPACSDCVIEDLCPKVGL